MKFAPRFTDLLKRKKGHPEFEGARSSKSSESPLTRWIGVAVMFSVVSFGLIWEPSCGKSVPDMPPSIGKFFDAPLSWFQLFEKDKKDKKDGSVRSLPCEMASELTGGSVTGGPVEVNVAVDCPVYFCDRKRQPTRTVYSVGETITSQPGTDAYMFTPCSHY